jgi:hypothetical protein
MSSHKPHGPKQEPSPEKELYEAKKEFCHCQIDSKFAVQIDIVQDLRNEIKAANHESSTQNRKQLFWTKVAAGLIFLYTLASFWQLKVARDTFIAQERPWVVIDNTEQNGVSVGVQIIGDVQITNNGTKASFTNIRYQLVNKGHTPANVFIYGHVAYSTAQLYERASAINVCNEARNEIRSRGWEDWTVMPGYPLRYDAGYTGLPGFLPQMDIDPRSQQSVVNYGCILYRSEAGDGDTIRQTPFIARISTFDKAGQPPLSGHPYPLTFSDGNIPATKLCVIDVLILGAAN